MKMKHIIKRIDELCDRITDGAHNSPEECINGPYPMYSSKDMLYGGFDDSDVKMISAQDYEKLVAQDCQPQIDDILIIKDGANYLKFAFRITHKVEAVILSSIAILRPNKSIINPDYFTYLLRTNSIRQAMSNYVSGSAIPRIVLKDFKKMKLRIEPNILFQKEIVKHLLPIDELIEVNNKRIKVLEQMTENLYKEWFVRFRFPGYETAEFENGLPKGWERNRISQYYYTSSGGTPSRENEENYENGTIPWIKTGEMQDCLLIDTEEHITEEAIKKSSAKLFPKDSVLMAMYGVNIGMLAYSTIEATCNQACCVFKDKGSINTKHYLFQYLKSIREHLLLIGFGAAQQNQIGRAHV